MIARGHAEQVRVGSSSEAWATGQRTQYEESEHYQEEMNGY